MHETIISQLFPDPFEDFGKSPLTQTFILKVKVTVNVIQLETLGSCMFKNQNCDIKAYKFKIFFPDFVKHHLADVVFVGWWRQRHFRALVAPAYKEARPFWRGKGIE